MLIKYQNFNFYLDCGLSSLGNGGLSVESHNYRGGHAVLVSIVTTDRFFCVHKFISVDTYYKLSSICWPNQSSQRAPLWAPLV